MRSARDVGREDVAREALAQKAAAEARLADLESRYQTSQVDEEKLTAASQRLQAKVEAFRTQKETFKATYTAAESQTRIGKVMSDITGQMSDVGMAMQRAQDRTTYMQTRAGAIDEVMDSESFDDVTGPPREDIQAELDRLDIGKDIDAELKRLKAEISSEPRDA